MSVIAKFVYEIKPGHWDDFMLKLSQAAGPQFNSPVMPQGVRLFKSSVAGSDTGLIQLFVEYQDMAAYGARTTFEENNAEWQKLFNEAIDSPQKLISVELLSEITPAAPL